MNRDFLGNTLLKLFQVGIVFVCTPYIQAQLAPFMPPTTPAGTPTGTVTPNLPIATPVAAPPAENTLSVLAQQGNIIQTLGAFL